MNIFERKEWRQIVGGIIINKQVAQECQELFEGRGLSSREIKNVAYFVKYGIHDHLVDQLNKLNDYILKYGCVQTLESYQLRYGMVAGIYLYELYKQSKITNLENLIKRYGKTEGTNRWVLFKQRCSQNRSLNRLIEKHGKQQGTRKWKRLQQKISKGVWGTKQFFIRKHGRQRGEAIYESKIASLRRGSTRAGFIEKYGEDQGNILLKERKNNTSHKSFIRRYGDIDGIQRYEKFIEAKRYHNTLDGYVKRHGPAVGPVKYNNWLNTSALGVCGYSRISQELFESLDVGSSRVYYATRNGEYCLADTRPVYFYDFVDITRGRVIEFNGDMWHANPEIYQSIDTPNPYLPYLTADQIWSRDAQKITAIKQQRGYDVLVVWERDYKLNRESIAQKCQNFLNEN